MSNELAQKKGSVMKLFAVLICFVSVIAHAKIEYVSRRTADGSEFQTCARYPDPAMFPGRRPVLMFIQGSGLYDTCLRLESAWGSGIVERGVIVYSRQKRGIRVAPKSGSIEIDRNVYVTNDLATLKADSVQAYEALSSNVRVNVNRLAVVGGSEGAWMAVEIGLKYPVREISLISSAIERFDVAHERQITHLIPVEIISALDSDKSRTLSSAELENQFLSSCGLRKFIEIDGDDDGQINANELAAEIRRVVNYSLATKSDKFFLSDCGGEVSFQWMRSAYSESSFGPRVLKLWQPVFIHHGRSDIHTSVKPVYALEIEAQERAKRNLSFAYYDGLGHELSKSVIYQILFDTADRLSK